MNENDFSGLTEEVLDSERIYSGKIFDLERLTVKLPDGNKSERDIIKHKGACAVLPIDGDDIIFVVQYRAAVNRLMPEIPAGKLESSDENPFDCAVRELSEETGYTAGKMTYLLKYIPAAGYSSEVIHIYVAEDLSMEDAHPDDDEFIQLVRIPIKKAVELCLNGEIEDSKTIIAILCFYEKYIKNV